MIEPSLGSSVRACLKKEIGAWEIAHCEDLGFSPQGHEEKEERENLNDIDYSLMQVRLTESFSDFLTPSKSLSQFLLVNSSCPHPSPFF